MFRAYHLTSEICLLPLKKEMTEHSLLLICSHTKLRKTSVLYAAAMGGVDAVVFTAGVGENDAATRSAVVEGLDFMGIKINEDKNAARGTVDISADDATVKTLVIPTNEELMIAIDTKRLVENK